MSMHSPLSVWAGRGGSGTGSRASWICCGTERQTHYNEHRRRLLPSRHSLPKGSHFKGHSGFLSFHFSKQSPSWSDTVPVGLKLTMWQKPWTPALPASIPQALRSQVGTTRPGWSCGFCFVLRQHLTVYPWLAWNHLCRQEWPETHRDLLAYAFEVLGLEVWTTMPGLDHVFKSPAHPTPTVVRSIFQRHLE